MNELAVLIVAAVVVYASIIQVQRARRVVATSTTVEELARRVGRLEDCEHLLLRVVVRTYDPDDLDPLASPFTVPPLDELVVMSVPLAVLADLFHWSADAFGEMSLLAPMPGFDGRPMELTGIGPGRFFDVVLTRADHG